MASVEKRQEQYVKKALELRVKEEAKLKKEKAAAQKLRRDGILFSEKYFTIRGKP